MHLVTFTSNLHSWSERHAGNASRFCIGADYRAVVLNIERRTCGGIVLNPHVAHRITQRSEQITCRKTQTIGGQSDRAGITRGCGSSAAAPGVPRSAGPRKGNQRAQINRQRCRGVKLLDSFKLRRVGRIDRVANAPVGETVIVEHKKIKKITIETVPYI